MARPGRPAREDGKGNTGKKFRQTMSPHRFAWVTLARLELGLYKGREYEPREETRASEEEVHIYITKMGFRGSMPLNLTMFTAAELQAFRDFFNLACDTAQPICEAIDQRAKEAFDAGDDSYLRLYRAVPVLHVRERSESAHDPGLPDGPGTPAGLREAPVHRVHDGGDGSGVADGGPPDVGAQDDTAAADDGP